MTKSQSLTYTDINAYAGAKNVRCEKHFFVKGGTCMINKRGVNTENSEQSSRKYRKLRVRG